ncbi:hypothetical protein BH09BAC1_BH09BAC1_16010 [soil metagenome]
MISKQPLRHSNFGGYNEETVARAYFTSEMFGPRVSPYELVDNIFWLLSNDSKWLPEKIHRYLLNGLSVNFSWPWGDYYLDKGGSWYTNGQFAELLFDSIDKVEFNLTEEALNDLSERAILSIRELNLSDNVTEITNKFLQYNIPKLWIENERKRKNLKR